MEIAQRTGAVTIPRRASEHVLTRYRIRHALRRLLMSSALVSACGSPPGPQTSNAAGPSFIGTVWMSTDEAAAAGTLRAFLPDGTLLMDSCVETYRLARWQSLDANHLAWEEDGTAVEAEVIESTPEILELRLRLVTGIK